MSITWKSGFLPTVVLLAQASAFFSLVAIWAGRSRLHWILRTLAVCLPFVLLYSVRAREPMPIFMAALPVVAVVSRLLGGQRDSRPSAEDNGRQVRLSGPGVLWAALPAAVTLLLFIGIWRDGTMLDWPSMCVAALCLTIVASLCAASVMVRGWWRVLPGVALVGSILGAALVHAWLLAEWTVIQCLVVPAYTTTPFAAALVFHAVMAALIVFVFVSARGVVRTVASLDTSLRWAAIVGTIEAATLLSMPLLALYSHMLHEPVALSDQGSTDDEEHGFQHLFDLARQVRDLNPNGTVDALRATGDTAAATQLDRLYARLILAADSPCRISEDFDVFGKDGRVFNELGVTCIAEIHGAAEANDFERVAALSIALVRIGNALCCGGATVHAMMGTALENRGTRQLITYREQLPLSEIPSLIKDLESVDRARESATAIIANGKVWDDKRFGWALRILTVMTPAEDALAASRPLVGMINRRNVYLRLLTVHLAIQLFERDRGQPPDNLRELVPQYLLACPTDPFRPRPLIYRRTGDTDVLYSVGLGGADDGGRLASDAAEYWKRGFDLDVDFDPTQPQEASQ